MTRSVIALAFCGVLVGGVAWAADEDLIGVKLATAKAEYEKGIGKARDGLLADLKKKAEVAQKAGDLKAFEKVEDEMKALEDKGTLPKLVSSRDYTEAARVARVRLSNAYQAAVKDYTVAGNTTFAKATQAALEDFKKETGCDTAKDNVPDDGLPVGTTIAGTAKWSDGPPGKRVGDSGKAEWTVTKRSGKEITLEGRAGYVFEGTITPNGYIKLRCVDAPIDQKRQIDDTVASGQFDKGKGTLDLKGGSKSNANSVIEWKFKVAK